MTNRQRGDRFEYQTRDHLEAHGWHVARRAGSHGLYDLLAIKRGRPPLFVSCKLNGMMPTLERLQLIGVADLCDAVPILAYKPRRGQIAYLQLYGSLDDDDWTPADAASEPDDEP